MKLIHQGKTKDIYDAGDGLAVLYFKDDVTGTEAGIDPGANQVIGQLEGKGIAALRTSRYFFDLFTRMGLPNHYVSCDEGQRRMTVRKAKWLGLEFICRYKAVGSFVRRYGKWVEEGKPLAGLVEITVKDDERGDPLINDESIVALGILSADQVEEAKNIVRKAAGIVREELSRLGLELLDLKFELGLVDGELLIIDDVSGDNMRVRKDDRAVDSLELSRLVCR
ncbi:MAG: phosphoribosylaminoimidazolesuccinocarboxamide synthase [Firmicutes bacterium]|nr:phosphoribosylaminoimidazolesuccinocarboxamide synthase [Bacillota bacterium]